MAEAADPAPVAQALDDLLIPLDAALEDAGAAVLVAEPGAGKTTRVPLHLAAANPEGRVIVLQPRRLAARLAATYMAAQREEPVGQTVGYRVRDEQRVSECTRVELVTDGLFLRRIQADPLLEDVGAVVFDEFHLRRPEAELALAFALQVRRLLRPELRILVMSATLDDEAVARLLAGPKAAPVPVLRARGRQFPVDVRHVPPAKDMPLADAVAQAVRDALAAEPGSLLVFLPGEREIREVAARLGEHLDAAAGSVRVAPLFGRLSAEEQNRAVRPAPAGERKVVLATDIAETSLTIEGVRVVIDTGLSREPRFDAATGLSRLVTVSASKAAAEQRAGRAGRTEPGVAIRLWARADEVQRPGYATPGLQQVDLLPLALELAGWGEAVAELDWLEPPPAHGLAAAQAVLAELGAVDAVGRITAHGRALLRLPTHPRLAHMLLLARGRGLTRSGLRAGGGGRGAGAGRSGCAAGAGCAGGTGAAQRGTTLEGRTAAAGAGADAAGRWVGGDGFHFGRVDGVGGAGRAGLARAHRPAARRAGRTLRDGQWPGCVGAGARAPGACGLPGGGGLHRR